MNSESLFNSLAAASVFYAWLKIKGNTGPAALAWQVLSLMLQSAKSRNRLEPVRLATILSPLFIVTATLAGS